MQGVGVALQSGPRRGTSTRSPPMGSGGRLRHHALFSAPWPWLSDCSGSAATSARRCRIWSTPRSWPWPSKRRCSWNTWTAAAGAAAYPGEESSPVRRWFHHFTFYGFLLCLASTTVAAIYDYVFHWPAPYSYISLPVILGTLGGIGLLIGPAGLLVLKQGRNRDITDAEQGGMDVAFLVLLFLTSMTGLLLLAFAGDGGHWDAVGRSPGRRHGVVPHHTLRQIRPWDLPLCRDSEICPGAETKARAGGLTSRGCDRLLYKWCLHLKMVKRGSSFDWICQIPKWERQIKTSRRKKKQGLSYT